MRHTDGYGERGFGFPGSDSALTSAEFISGAGAVTASTLDSDIVSGVASAFCTVVSAVAGSEPCSVGAGRALLLAEVGRRAFPIC